MPELEAMTGPWPERQILDNALWTLCRPRMAAVHACRVSTLEFRDETVRVRIGTRSLCFDVAVDATGATRATVVSVAQACGTSMVLHEGPPSGGYVTVRLAGVGSLGDARFLACRHPESGGGAILVKGADTAACLTLQLPYGARAPMHSSAIRAFLAEFTDPRLPAAYAAARLQGRPIRFAGRRTARLALEATSGLPGSWVPVGDCLLTTPPYLGQGIDQLTEQVDLMASGLAARLSWPEIRSSMVDRARERWWGATWVEALRSVADDRPAARHATSEGRLDAAI